MSNTDQIILDHTAAVGHGNTVAAWACVAVMTVGVIVGCVGFITASVPVTVVGIGFIVVGLEDPSAAKADARLFDRTIRAVIADRVPEEAP